MSKRIVVTSFNLVWHVKIYEPKEGDILELYLNKWGRIQCTWPALLYSYLGMDFNIQYEFHIFLLHTVLGLMPSTKP